MLDWDYIRTASGGGSLADDRFAKTITLQSADLRDDYFSALRRVALPFLNLFTAADWFDPESWLTREAVDAQFKRLEMNTIKLVEDDR